MIRSDSNVMHCPCHGAHVVVEYVLDDTTKPYTISVSFSPTFGIAAMTQPIVKDKPHYTVLHPHAYEDLVPLILPKADALASALEASLDLTEQLDALPPVRCTLPLNKELES